MQSLSFSEDHSKKMLVKAYTFALNSPDPSTQNGAIVISGDGGAPIFGCNTFTWGMKPSPKRLERPLKYTYVEHAERNAIFAAASVGAALEGGIMWCPWAACTECARAIVQVRIKTLVRHKQASDRSPERWIESIALADEILLVGDVDIIEIDCDDLGVETPIMHCEEPWKP